MEKIDLKELFGKKCRYKKDVEVHKSLRDMEFAFLGACNSAVALVEWEKRGEYSFEYYTSNISKLEFLEN
jgi:hypothetical protein